MAENFLTIQTVAREINLKGKYPIQLVKKLFCHQIVTLIGHSGMQKKTVSYQDRICEWVLQNESFSYIVD